MRMWFLLIALWFFAAAHAQHIFHNNDNLVPFSMDWRGFAHSDLDLSFLLETPAGKAGFTTIKDGHFYTANDKRLRIWGVNLTGGACFPEKEDAPRVAEFLAKIGINGVRFHFLDSNWGRDKSIFNYELNTTREMEPAQLDRLDFFMAELKKRGIYSNFNLNVGRNFRAGDDVADHHLLGLAKAVTLFDDHIIELQKEYASQLLTHTNPYTGNSYVDEPALIIVEIVNENSLVEAWFTGRLLGENTTGSTGTWSDIPPSYAQQLTQKYNVWLSKNIALDDLKKLKAEAGVTEGDLLPRLKPDEFEQASKLRFHTEAEFIIQTERAFFTGMYEYLKNDLKLHAHVAGNSDHNHSKPGYALLFSLAELDVVDGHVYWQHPNYFKDPETGQNTFSIKNTPMVNDPFRSTVVQLSRSAVTGKPYTVSETNHPFPNEYACEGVPILAAYALLQNWDGIFFYTLEHGDPQEWNDKTPNYFDLYADPVKMATIAAASLMFHRGDIQSAQNVVLRNYSREQLIEGIREDASNMPMFTPGFSHAIPLMFQTRIQSFKNDKNNYPQPPMSSPILSQTGELIWHHADNAGQVVIDAPMTQSIIGFGREFGHQPKNMSVNITNPFGSILLSSLDNKPIEQSENLLLATTARAGLSGMEWNADRTSLTRWGEKPTVIEPVTGTILLKLENAETVMLKTLNGQGQIIRTETISPTENGDFLLTLSDQTSPWYLLDVRKQN